MIPPVEHNPLPSWSEILFFVEDADVKKALLTAIQNVDIELTRIPKEDELLTVRDSLSDTSALQIITTYLLYFQD